jgi:ABC-type Zn uptake system ZnuABC Zn-binding protein ZnuA
MSQSATAINKLYILANMQENIILHMQDPEFKHLAKQNFNRVIKEVKKLNNFINTNLSDVEAEGIDTITEEVETIFNKYV